VGFLDFVEDDTLTKGRQVGAQAARVLEQGDSSGVKLERVAVRKRVFNPQSAAQLGIRMPPGFDPVSAP
jgi:ABC-type uncharacterized transport system substrate-binding protein